jgi:transcriptional regulator with XRE-family HTH domain
LGYSDFGYTTLWVPPKSIYSDSYLKLLSLIRAARTAQGLTQVQLSTQLGRPQSWVSKVESGERRLDVDELRAMCAALDIDLIGLIQNWLAATPRVARRTARH